MTSAPSHRIEPLEARIAPALMPVVELSGLTGKNGFQMNGEAEGDAAGRAVSDAGDVNGDGYADVIIGSFGGNDPDSGSSYVVFGHAGSFVPQIDLSSLDGANGFKVIGENFFLSSVSGAGDINGDGFDDVVIGTFSDEVCYVVFGHDGVFPATITPSSLDGTSGFKIHGEGATQRTGFAVSGAGDVNGDGFDDLLIGAPQQYGVSNAGYGYVVFGHGGAFAATFELSTLDGTNGFKTHGGHGDYAGWDVSSAGDLNGDGFADLLIGGLNFVPNGPYSNAADIVYVVFGHRGAFPKVVELPKLDGLNGFQFVRPVPESDGHRVSAAGDVNGDGFGDLIVGAPLTTSTGDFLGASYVVFGHDGAFPAVLDPASLDGASGFKITHGNGGGFAHSVSGAGDVNGDGFDDLLIGAPFGSLENEKNSGDAFVVFGHGGVFARKVDISTLSEQDGFRISGASRDDGAGNSVSGAGDVNGDGFADIVIGAEGADPQGEASGASYVVFGRPTGKTYHFLDVDGDRVIIRSSVGFFDPRSFTLVRSGAGERLELLTLTDSKFTGADITIKARPRLVDGTLLGDGRVNIGLIDATGIDLGNLKIDGDLTAFHGGADSAGLDAVKMLRVGSLGTAQNFFPTLAAGLEIAGRVGRLAVRGDVLDFSAMIDAGVGLLGIDGNLAGSTIGVGRSIDRLTVGGSILDSTVRAPGLLLPANDNNATAIGFLRVRGDMLGSSILAGHDGNGSAINGDAGIGVVVIRGDFAASNIVAGIADSTGDGFGRNDTLIPGSHGAIVSTIARLVIRGATTGSIAGGDFFGVTAEMIGEATIHRRDLTLTTDKDNVLLDAANGDFRLVEI